MREIKFRAWDKPSQQFVKGWYLDSDGKKFQNGRELEDGIETLDLELQQYTGLKDKNGKEIYQGDVVTHRFEDYEEFTNYKIVWSAVECAFRMEEIGGGHHTMYVSKNSEIIGNIYENPELLKD